MMSCMAGKLLIYILQGSISSLTCRIHFDSTQWGSPTNFTLMGGTYVLSVITFGTSINNVTNVNYDIDLYVFV